MNSYDLCLYEDGLCRKTNNKHYRIIAFWLAQNEIVFEVSLHSLGLMGFNNYERVSLLAKQIRHWQHTCKTGASLLNFINLATGVHQDVWALNHLLENCSHNGKKLGADYGGVILRYIAKDLTLKDLYDFLQDRREFPPTSLQNARTAPALDKTSCCEIM